MPKPATLARLQARRSWPQLEAVPSGWGAESRKRRDVTRAVSATVVVIVTPTIIASKASVKKWYKIMTRHGLHLATSYQLVPK